MRLDFQEMEQGYLVRVIGRITVDSASDLRADILNVAEEGPERFILDLSEVPFVDTSGLGVFLALRKDLQKRGIALELRNLQERVHVVFKMTRLTALFGIPD